MKKLLFAAAIVCAAVMSQAASLDWKFTETVKTSTWPADTYQDLTKVQAYLFAATDWTTFMGLDASAKTFEAFEAASSAGGVAITSGGTSSLPKFETGTQQFDGAKGNYYVILADEKIGYFASSVFADVNPYDHGDPTAQHKDAAWSITATSSTKLPVASGDFTAFASVPEPTSGLLLLLGVAGLALRRRRA